ncbi:Omega-3 fatty acid desaturase, chloroplastic [Tetrabaena socialis]|uniref:Omega-3 fatty acid desaturase, chloroplastic n=1 Tax=Tetrabaena socialis TaxID=47790 RepID=A0A2J8A1D3_9CHLO|nr:Omega-3 fatty acid desaturase, chloroplastic [Tetrabaena socialis]|eukprot:PNH06305.1 Omega-3 fatty acid desaturase, chloroplastic [Tetrabaena socialis]
MQCLAPSPVLAPLGVRRTVARVAPALGRRTVVRVANIAAVPEATASDRFKRKADGSYDLSAPPPFNLADLRAAIPAHCWEKNSAKSMAHLALDVAVVFGIAAVAFTVNQWWLWPLYWVAQGTMFWALFVVGHDCGHQSFSNNKTLNDFVGHLAHASILVPYHGWRISHRTHHANHGHVENDESWHPVTKTLYDKLDSWARVGRLSLPWALFAFPFYLWKRSPGKEGSHYDPSCDLFTAGERNQVMTTNAYLIGMLAVLAACTIKLGPLAILNLYVLPYWINVMWLDLVTYLHHHGSHDANEEMPWYRGEEWSYLRGGLTTIDRDYGIFNKIHHDIGTHVVHHLFPQIPHYNLEEATAAVKPVMGPYYREPTRSPGPLPFHLIEPLVRSFSKDHFVKNTGDIVYYEADPAFPKLGAATK